MLMRSGVARPRTTAVTARLHRHLETPTHLQESGAGGSASSKS